MTQAPFVQGRSIEEDGGFAVCEVFTVVHQGTDREGRVFCGYALYQGSVIASRVVATKAGAKMLLTAFAHLSEPAPSMLDDRTQQPTP